MLNEHGIMKCDKKCQEGTLTKLYINYNKVSMHAHQCFAIPKTCCCKTSNCLRYGKIKMGHNKTVQNKKQIQRNKNSMHNIQVCKKPKP